MPQSSPRILNSWKEIAAYLDVNIRTAQNWESERGLPVNRLPGGRGRVWANATAIDEWRTNPQQASKLPAEGRWTRRAVIIAASGILLLAATAAYRLQRRRPGGHRIESHVLVVLDTEGREFWRAAFPRALDVKSYNPFFDKRVWTGDIDNDGNLETIFALLPSGPLEESSALICYSSTGKELWRHIPGRTVSIGGQQYGPPFLTHSFAVIPGRGAEPGRIVAVNLQTPYFASQVVLLSHKGQILREYWHAGHIPHITILDLNNDGSPEIYLGGVSNSHRCAEVVVLDPETFSGAGVETEAHYIFDSMTAGNELARIFFPRSCINRKTQPYNVTLRTWLQDGSVNVETDERPAGDNITPIIFRLERDLTPLSVSVSDSFRAAHSQMESLRQLDHPWSEPDVPPFQNVQVVRGR